MGILLASSLGCDILYLLLLWMMANKVDDICYNNKFLLSVGLSLCSLSVFAACELWHVSVWCVDWFVVEIKGFPGMCCVIRSHWSYLISYEYVWYVPKNVCTLLMYSLPLFVHYGCHIPKTICTLTRCPHLVIVFHFNVT